MCICLDQAAWLNQCGVAPTHTAGMAQVHLLGEQSAGKKTVPLLSQEKQRYAGHNGIQTVSFFSAGRNSGGMGSALGLMRDHVRARATELMKANPWMCGHIVGSKSLEYSLTVTDADIDSVLLFPDKLAEFNRETPYEALNLEVLKLAGIASANSKECKAGNAPIVKIVVIPTSEAEVALCFSMSHFIVDGHTYYKLFNMLCSTGPIESMIIDRPLQTEYNAIEQRLSGSELLQYGAGLSFIKHIVWNNALVKQPYSGIMCQYLDDAAVKTAKENSPLSCGGAGGNGATTVPYVTTNDLVVSLMGRLTTVDFLMQTINYRNREPTLTDLHAGNYENVIGYDEAGYSSAAEVRQSLLAAPYGNIKRLPGFCEKVRMGIYTSWLFPTTFAVPGCDLELHLPIMNFDPAGSLSAPLNVPCDVAISFRPQTEKVAVIIFCARAGKAQYEEHKDNILGATVSESVFGGK